MEKQKSSMASCCSFSFLFFFHYFICIADFVSFSLFYFLVCGKSVTKNKKTGCCSPHHPHLPIQTLKTVHQRFQLQYKTKKKKRKACWSTPDTLNDNCLAMHMKQQKGNFSIKQRVMKVKGVGADTFLASVILEHIIEIVSTMQTVCLSAAHTCTVSWMRRCV